MKILLFSILLIPSFIQIYGQNTTTEHQNTENKNLPQYKTGYYIDKRDGKTYKTIQIGTQVWFAENLAYKQRSRGCKPYRLDKKNVSKYGYLYTWKVAKKSCPQGWHLPSKDEWQILIDNIGSENAGIKMKSETDWNLFEGKNYGNNESGFNALPGGSKYVYSDDFSLSKRVGKEGFRDIGLCCNWWSSSVCEKAYTPKAWSIYLGYSSIVVYLYDKDIKAYYSVRCVKN